MAEFLPKDKKEWREWLEKNHLKETNVILIKYKKHTGKPSITNKEAMEEAICFGWIDTTINRIDDEKYSQKFVKRNKNSKWSINTLSYGKELLKKGLMSEFGIKMYKEGLLKKPHDIDLPRDPEPPAELIKLLNKNKIAKANFEKMSKSNKRMHLRNILRAKMKETREKRINELIENLSKKPK